MYQDHHYNFVTIYPGVSVIPKMHFMIHMAHIILGKFKIELLPRTRSASGVKWSVVVSIYIYK